MQTRFKSMFKAVHKMMACTDCLMWVANGDEPEGDTEWNAYKIDAIWPPKQFDLACGDTENDHDFSWSPCECCGSRLGGSRHELIALEKR